MFEQTFHMSNTVEWNFSKGQKLRIILIDQEFYFEGEFYGMNSERSRITLTKVTRYPDKTYFKDQYDFFRTEVKYIKAQLPEEGMEAVLDPNHGRSLAHNKIFTHAHLYRMSGQNIASKKDKQKAIEVKKGHEKYPLYQQLLESYIILNKIDNQFYEILATLSKEEIIGLSLEGQVLGRTGVLCWLNINSSSCTVLFDILQLGKKAFELGLQRLLQSQTVTKVMHDCRMAADCLLHQYNTRLINVIDTQAMELTIMRLQMEKFPQFVTSLTDCLQRYLHIPQEILTFPLLREAHLKTDTKKWTARPLDEESESLAMQNVVFLRDLHRSQLRTLMEPARLASEQYVSLVASMPAPEANNYYSCIHFTPRVIHNISKKYREEEQRNMDRLNPSIRFSRDVMHYYDTQHNVTETPSGVASPTFQTASTTVFKT